MIATIFESMKIGAIFMLCIIAFFGGGFLVIAGLMVLVGVLFGGAHAQWFHLPLAIGCVIVGLTAFGAVVRKLIQ